MVIRSGGSRDGARSIQLPTADAQSMVETVDVIPRSEAANRVFGKARDTRRIWHGSADFEVELEELDLLKHIHMSWRSK